MATDEPFLIWCGPDTVPRLEGRTFKKVVPLATTGPRKNVYLKFENIHKKLAHDIPAIVLDLIELASYVYCADQAVTRGGPTLPRDGKAWNRRLHFSVPVRRLEVWQDEKVSDCLCRTLSFLSDDHYQFEFRALENETKDTGYFDFDKGEPWFRADSVLLFSGGLDSLTGAVQELKGKNRKIALVSHRPVAKISSRQQELVKHLRASTGTNSDLLHVPVWVNKDSGLTKDANQRSRSFLYAALGAAVGHMLGADGIKFYENGIVSVNLPISEQIVGGRASRSTHPAVLAGFQQLLSAIFDRSFTVQNPFLWKTKSDVVADLVESGGAGLMPLTSSCSHTWHTTKVHTHCGTCSQCIERRIAALHNNVGEHDPSEMYETDLFMGPVKERLSRTMLFSYIEHARTLENTSDIQFFQKYGELARVLPYVGLPTSEAASNLWRLHHRHGMQVGSVVTQQIRVQAEAIRGRRLENNSLLAAIVVSQGKMQETRSGGLKFPTPDGTTWDDIAIEVTSDSTARVRVQDITKTYSALDMGFRDRRTGDALSKQWQLLLLFAHGGGVLSWAVPGAKLGYTKPVQELARTLKSFFGIQESPIRKYVKKVGWVTRFKLRDRRHMG